MGSRYGRKIRNLADAADVQRRDSYECPKCTKVKVRRKGNSLWKCRSCGATFAGGTYSFTTPMGETTKRLLKDASK